MECHDGAIGSQVHIGLQVGEAEANSMGKCSHGVLRPLAGTPTMGKCQHAGMAQERMAVEVR